MNVPLLQLINLSKSYRNGSRTVNVLSGFNLEVHPGDFVFIKGPSGCGKTTLLLMAGGLLSPDLGEVKIDGRDIYRASARERSRQRTRAGFVFQQFHLLPYLNIMENVMVPSLTDADSPRNRERAMELLIRFGLQERSEHFPSELSTGERQRTALARALMNRPQILLADEPTGNLDDENAEAVLRSLSSFAREGGAVLLVSHTGAAGRYARRTITLSMNPGKELSLP